MPSDIVIPRNNESDFIKMAERLGIRKLYFLYDFDDYPKKMQKSNLKGKLNIGVGFLVNQKNINKAQHHSRLLVARSSGDDRHVMEGKKISVIYGFEEVSARDYLHQRASGLNHTICELANKNNVAIGLPYSLLLNKNSEASSLLMGRMMQNIALCQKYKVKTIIGSFSQNPFEMRAPHDVASLFSLMGMDGKTIKEFMYFEVFW